MADNGFKINKSANFNPQNGTPANPVDGDFFYDAIAQSFAYYHNGSWANFDSIGTVAATEPMTSAQFTPALVRNSIIKITGGSTPKHLDGISSSFSGKTIKIYNAGTSYITVEHEDVAEPTANNRIRTPTAGDMNLIAGEIATFTYDVIQNRWLLVSISSQAGAQLIATTSSPGIVTLHQASTIPADGIVLSDGDLNTANGVIGLDANRAASIAAPLSAVTALSITAHANASALTLTSGSGSVALMQATITSGAADAIRAISISGSALHATSTAGKALEASTDSPSIPSCSIINTVGFTALDITGTLVINNANTALSATSTSNVAAIYGQTTNASGIGVWGDGGNAGTGVRATSTIGIAASVSTTSGNGLFSTATTGDSIYATATSGRAGRFEATTGKAVYMSSGSSVIETCSIINTNIVGVAPALTVKSYGTSGSIATITALSSGSDGLTITGVSGGGSSLYITGGNSIFDTSSVVDDNALKLTNNSATEATLTLNNTAIASGGPALISTGRIEITGSTGGPALRVTPPNNTQAGVEFLGTNPASSSAFANSLTKSNLVKSWGYIDWTSGAGTVPLKESGFNFSTVTVVGTAGSQRLRVTFPALGNMSSVGTWIPWCFIMTPSTSTTTNSITVHTCNFDASGTYFEIIAQNTSDGTIFNLGDVGGLAGTLCIGFAVLGLQ